MKKLLQTFGIILGTFYSLQAQIPSFSTFTGQAGVVSVLNDGSYVTAYDSTYTGSPTPGQAIKKVNADGSIAWIHLLKRSSYILSAVKINAIADDGNGGAIVAGNFQDVVYFGTDSLKAIATFNKNILIMRVNATGKVWWMKAGGDDANYVGEDNANFLEVKNSNIYVAGLMSSRGCNIGSINFPRGTYGATTKFFLAKLNMEGTTTWANLTTGGGAYVKNMKVDASENIYLIGEMTNSSDVKLNNTTTVVSADQGIFVAKYNNTGAVTFVKAWCEYAGGAVARDIAVDKDANMYIVGFSGNFGSNFKGFTLPAKVSYLLKLNADATIAWWRFLKAEMNASVLTGPQGVVVSGANVFVMGNFSVKGYLQSNATDSITIQVRSGLTALSETYIARYSSTGNLDWHETGKHDGFITNNQATGMGSSPNQSKIIIKGTFSTNAKFGTLMLPAVGTLGAYVFGFIGLSTGSGGTSFLNPKSNNNIVQFYPNPATNQVTISLVNSNNPTNVNIYDYTGKILINKIVEPNADLTINTETLNKGVYIISIENNDSKIQQKLIIQ